MDKQYMAVLWGGKDRVLKEEKGDSYRIEEFETIQDAVKFLVSNGAFFEHQEIVQKISWLPGAPQTVSTPPSQSHKMTPEEEELAKKPNPTTPPGPDAQPKVIGDTGPKLKRSIFEGIVPDAMIPQIQRAT